MFGHYNNQKNQEEFLIKDIILFLGLHLIKKNTYNRYCHVFTKDEVVYILSNIDNITITNIFNEMSNWYVELNKN